MSTKFSGSFDELKALLVPLNGNGEWNDLNENQKQYRHQSGGILNWYPSTGTILVQGKTDAKAELERIVGELLSRAVDLPPAPNDLTVPEVNGPVVLNGEAAERPAQEVTQEATPPVETPTVPQPGPTTIAPPSSSVPTSTTSSTTTPIVLPTQPIPSPTEPVIEFMGRNFADSELVIGIVGAVGTKIGRVSDLIQERLRFYGYNVKEIRISSDVIPKIIDVEIPPDVDECSRINRLMDAGNQARMTSHDNSILALGAAAKIAEGRPADEEEKPLFRRRCAYIINSLKHPDEVTRLKEIYPESFYLIGAYSEEIRRHLHLTRNKRISIEEATSLIERDADEHLEHGQQTRETYHLADFFVYMDDDDEKLRSSIYRILNILFGDPYKTPTFDEYAMFMAFCASLRSADLSRQVGAVVANNNEILATGANDCPKFGGGLYWPEINPDNDEVYDLDDGRDYKRGEDKNKIEKDRIINGIVGRLVEAGADRETCQRILAKSGIKDITEYGRMVHAEMEALLSCARNHISTKGADLYCTTFPCHNCAKHIIAAGIKRVVYVEPYPKSKAVEFHSDSITLGRFDGNGGGRKNVYFEPFVGVGPRKFFDLFSMTFGTGRPIIRKDTEGHTIDWQPETSSLRIQMLPCSYLERESVATKMFEDYRRKLADERSAR